MLNNLAGWHVVIILGVVLALVVFVIVVVAVALRLAARSSLTPTPNADPVSQLQGLGRLRDQGLISEAEYEAKRQDLLKRI